MYKRRTNWPVRILILVTAIVVVTAIWINVFEHPKMIQVCNNDPYNPYYGKIITVREGEQINYKPVDDPACAKR